MRRIFISSLLLIIVLAFFLNGCSERKVEVEPQQDSRNAWLFNLSDETINDAIKKGSNADRSEMFQLEYNYFIKVTENHLDELKDFPPYVYFYSPYFQIILKSFNDSQKMITPSVEEMKGMIRKNVLDFYINAYGNDPSMGNNFHAVLKQGDVTIQPINGKISMSNAERVHILSENLPQYKKVVSASFQIDDRIDIDLPLSLVFIYSGKQDYAVYEFSVKN